MFARECPIAENKSTNLYFLVIAFAFLIKYSLPRIARMVFLRVLQDLCVRLTLTQ
jgi:hypothetical protein